MADNEQNAEVAQMKMVKFKATVERLQKYLWPYRSSSSVPCVPVGPEWLSSYVDNPYINMLVAESIFSRCEMGNNVYGYVQNNSFSVSKPNATGSSYYDIRVPESAPYDTVFWFFMLAAIDDRIYNDQLDYIVDVAYLLHFSEAMIRDWCRAVVYILDGHTLSPDCDLMCETEEGKTFFLHQ